MSLANDAFAHLTGDGRTQSLLDHLMAVSLESEHLAAKIELARVGALIGLMHDLGKYSSDFQQYLRSMGPDSEIEPQDVLKGRIDHSSAGAQVVANMLGVTARTRDLAKLAGEIAALCIASHHSGLIDCLSPDGTDSLARRLNKADIQTHCNEAWNKADLAMREKAEHLLAQPKLVNEVAAAVSRILHIDGARNGRKNIGDFKIGLLLRVLFSCLIDADRIDTADFEKPRSAEMRQRGSYPSWNSLLRMLEIQLRAFPADSAVDRIRREVSSECLAAAERPRGIYTLTVPTGGGKTLASLRFALAHAQRWNMDHVIYISPYTSIVDQNAAAVREILEPNGTEFASIVLEHHSNLTTEKDTWRSKVLAENWDAPIVFTTAVQTLESLFGSGTRAVRRLHTMARAVLIFDEIQTLPVHMVHLFNNAINFLTEQCGSTILLCTATQPLFHKVDATKGAARLAANAELMPDVSKLFRGLKRYEVFDESRRPGGWQHQDVAELACNEAREHDSCLVIVNTKRDAREIYELCQASAPDGCKVLHLSAHMCPAHRSEKLAEMKTLLKLHRGGRVICVSTQLVEAGVDIDFACVVRDLAGLDSIAQAAGRCNRHGTRPTGRVHIVRLARELPAALKNIRKGQEAAATILGKWNRQRADELFDLAHPEQMEAFFKQYFFDRAKEMSYNVTQAQTGDRDDTLLRMLGSNGMAADCGRGLTRDVLLQSFHSAADAFHGIDSPAQGIIVPFGEVGNKIIERICSLEDFGAEWRLLRQAQQYTVSVFPQTLRRLQERGAVYEALKGTGVLCLQPGHYNDEFGLQVKGGLVEGLFA